MSKWNLTHFYKNIANWETDLAKLDKQIAALVAFKGKLNTFEGLKGYYSQQEQTMKLFFTVYAYAHLDSDLNLKNTEKSSRVEQVMTIYSKLAQATSFVSPEILSVGKEKIMSFVAQDDQLKTQKFGLEDLFFQQKHVLSEAEEKIIANYGPIRNASANLHQSLSIIDAVDETAKLSNGDKVITLSNYRSLLPEAKTADDRRLIFEAAYKRFINNKTSYANAYNLVLQNLAANYKSRGFNSALEQALFRNNIPTKVFHNLKDTAWNNTAPIKRYMEIRKKSLGIKDYKTYDRFINLANDETKYDFEQAKEVFFKSIAKMDPLFIKYQKQAIEDGFVDVWPSDGKRTGAYSSGFFGHHPYILLNHDSTLDSVFTLVHEAGHSAHSMLANDNQPMATADYTIFVAEIASTFNEHVLLDYLLEQATTKVQKITLLESAINGIMATFYRQTLFATYEYEANLLVEKGIPVTVDSLSSIMVNLYKQYYGLDIKKEVGKELIWSYIPHLFGSPFYVYQYATSYSASLKIYQDVKKNKKGAMDKFLELLKSGGSDYPVELVKKAGADLTKIDTFNAVIVRFNDLLDQLEKTL